MLLSRINQRVGIHHCIWAAATVLCNAGTAVATTSTSTSTGSISSPTRSCSSTSTSTSSSSMSSYPLTEKWRLSDDSWLLRFSLPPGRKYLGNDENLPTCISVHHNDTSDIDGDGQENNKRKILKKSYSPVSHPGTVGSFDLLVKSYTPQPGGGVGAAICNLTPGQVLVGKLKAERMVHGSPIVSKRWDRIGLVAGGTGVAPLVQIIRICLEDPHDNTKIYLLSINRHEEDILMRDELDRLAKEHPDQLFVKYSLTSGSVGKDWGGLKGRGSVDMTRQALPPPTATDGKSTMIFVCGTDGFRDMWAGPVARAPPKADGSKGAKIQGPLLGVLLEAGYDASDVFKY